MSILLADALKLLALQPGQSQRLNVGDYQVEIRRIDGEKEVGPLLDLWLEIPFSSKATTLVAKRGSPQVPPPFEIVESDLTPE